jgi:hypothetical protein
MDQLLHLQVDRKPKSLPPAAARSLPGSLDLIPDSESNSSATASSEEIRKSEEDLASVPSTVHVGSPGITNEEEDPLARPFRSPGGT